MRLEERIYFDNSATTKIHPEVAQAYIKTSEQIMGNPSSLHQLGSQASLLLRKARLQIAETMGCQPNEIFFTSGGTEGDNWVLKGTAIEKRRYGKHMLISAIEHPAIKETAAQLRELGFEIDEIPVTKKGIIDVEAFQSLLREDTILVSIMAVNNEIGTIQPIAQVAEILESYPQIHFHVDAVQAIGQIPTEDYLVPRVDFVTFSAHKFHGPRGIGFIYWKEGRRLAPLITGGGQEQNQRSGTENLPAIVGMAKALRLLFTNNQEKRQHERELQQTLRQALSEYQDVYFFTPADETITAPHILCFGLEGIRGEVLVHALEQQHIFISTTSACSSKKDLKMNTLQAMKVPNDIADTAVRVSFCAENTLSEVHKMIQAFALYHHRLKDHS